MESITLSCRYGYVKLVDMSGKNTPEQLPKIGFQSESDMRSQFCIGLKGNQQFESAALICGSKHSTSLHEHSSLTVFDRLFIGCGDRLYCITMPHLVESWFYGLGARAFLGVGTIDDDVLVMFRGELSRLKHDGTLLWSTSIPDHLTVFPIVGNSNLTWNTERLSSPVLQVCDGSILT